MVSVVHDEFLFNRISHKAHSQQWHKELHPATLVVLEDRRLTWKWPTAIDLRVWNSKSNGPWTPGNRKKKDAENCVPNTALVCVQSTPPKKSLYICIKIDCPLIWKNAATHFIWAVLNKLLLHFMKSWLDPCFMFDEIIPTKKPRVELLSPILQKSNHIEKQLHLFT